MVKVLEARGGNPPVKEPVTKRSPALGEAGTPAKGIEVFLGKTSPAKAKELGATADTQAKEILKTFGAQFMLKDPDPISRISNGGRSTQSPEPTFSKRGRIQAKDDGGTGPGEEGK